MFWHFILESRSRHVKNKFSKFRNLKFDRSNVQVLDNEFLTLIWIQFEFKIADERSTVQTIKF